MENEKFLYIIAGPNGAGKTTASMSILPTALHCKEFVNADSIAKGISPLNPEDELVGIQAGKLMMQRVAMLLQTNENFAIETTLATRSHASLVKEAQAHGFTVILLFFRLANPDISVRRVAQRVQEGGHHIPTDTIFRRYRKGLLNLQELFIPVVDYWMIYDSSDTQKVLIEAGCRGQQPTVDANALCPTLRHIHEGLCEAQHQMLRTKAERNETLVRVDEQGHAYDQSARAALLEEYGEKVGGQLPDPHPLNPFEFPNDFKI